MKGKPAAALLGILVGASLIILMELTDVWLSEGGFFDTGRSWLLLTLFVLIFPFLMVNAYQNRRGIYADRDEPTGDEQDPN